MLPGIVDGVVSHVNPTTRMTGPYWPEPVRLIAHTESPYGYTSIEAVGTNTGRHYTTTLPTGRLDDQCSTRVLAPTFRSGAPRFALAIEAQRLRLAAAGDPLLALNNSLVHVVPHQLEAVYDVMLPQPTLRHLLAHDAGAGKTVMAGLVYKELSMRRPALRTLIVAPAGLTRQWQRELRDKFLVHFDIVERDSLNANPAIWTDGNRLITSLHFARLADVQLALANVAWDLVIVDEAHHLAGYEDRATQAYRLGQILARQSHHLILATATPHKGDPHNFLRLVQLLDPGIHDVSVVQMHGDEPGGPLMLRRLKEEMVTFDGEPLFKARAVETRCYSLGDSDAEMALYSDLTEYVNKTYKAAERKGGRIRVNVQFAMTILQRRMASSLAALERSLLRRRQALQRAEVEQLNQPTERLADEDLSEAERWEQERRLEVATTATTSRERQREIGQLDGLLHQVSLVRGGGAETKVRKLQEVMGEAGIAPGNGEKLLVFTEFKDTLDFLRRLFEEWGYAVTQIDGSMAMEERLRAEAEFKQRAQVMVATEAAGEGINLQFCARMVNYDLPWVPTRLEQRMGRIHRYGQARDVCIYNLTTADTREGKVLVGLLDRLDAERKDLGDAVFDVISALTSDIDFEALMTQVALAELTESSQWEALNRLKAAVDAGAERQRRWQQRRPAVDAQRFAGLRDASRQFRLTPEYAQHFFVNAWREMGASVEPDGQPDILAGDAAVLRHICHRRSLAEQAGLEPGRPTRYTFRAGLGDAAHPARFVALGSPLFDVTLRLVEREWDATRFTGACFLDPGLAPGDAYLLWFVAAQVLDGLGDPVERNLYAVRQTPEGMAPLPNAVLNDLVPETGAPRIPPALLALAREPQVVLNWSIQHQQLACLRRVQQQRVRVSDLRRAPMLHDARLAVEGLTAAYNQAVFTAPADAPPESLNELVGRQRQAQARYEALQRRFEREAACYLGAPEVVGVAAVLSMVDPTEEDVIDSRPEIAAAAERLARQYEVDHGRTVHSVSGEHADHPYDLHSSGPGGVRCIEVKGTTTGRVTLSENERRAAERLGPAYYLYVVRDPLGAARLSIIRNPAARMTPDATLYGNRRYVYKAATWQAATDEEAAL